MTVSVTINVTHNGETQPTRSVGISDAALNAVLFDFNPSANDDVTVIKVLSAALIEKMRPLQAMGGQRGRNAAIAITEIEGAQMRAVKALFAK